MYKNNTVIIKNRIEWVDIAKGIGIILVIVGHLLPSGSYVRTLIYAFHMPMFFILSGLIYKIPPKNSICKDRLLPTYLLYSSIFVITDLSVRVFWLEEYKVTGFIWEVYETLTFYGINVLWYLATTMICRWILCKLLNSYNCIKIVIMCTIIYFFTAQVGQIYNMDTESKTIIRLLLYYPVLSILRAGNVLIYFSIGYYLKEALNNFHKNYNLFKKTMYSILGISLVGVLSVWCGEVDVHALSYANPYLAIVCGIVGSVAVYLISMAIESMKLIKEYLIFCGKNTILMMVLHEYLFVSRVVAGCLSSVNQEHNINIIILTILVTSVLTFVLRKPLSWVERKMALYFSRV